MGKVKQLKQSKKSDSLKLDVFEAEVIFGVFQNSTVRQTIKDMRLTLGVVDKLNKVIPKRAERPKAEYKDPKNPTESEKKEYSEKMKSWAKESDEVSNSPVNLDLNSVELAIVKQRVAGASYQSSNEQVRNKVLKLADKLGI